MQQGKDLITQPPAASAKTSAENANNGPATTRRERQKIQTLWNMMTSMFGHKWVSSYGAEVDPDRVWLATLDGVTSSQVKVGLGRLRERGDEWPPSAPEFRKLCLERDSMLPQQRATKMADAKREAERKRQLEHKPDPEQVQRVRASALNNIWETIGGRPGP